MKSIYIHENELWMVEIFDNHEGIIFCSLDPAVVLGWSGQLGVSGEVTVIFKISSLLHSTVICNTILG